MRRLSSVYSIKLGLQGVLCTGFSPPGFQTNNGQSVSFLKGLTGRASELSLLC